MILWKKKLEITTPNYDENEMLGKYKNCTQIIFQFIKSTYIIYS